jgi:hypothetical protein
MNDFLLVFRREPITNEPAPSPEQMQAIMKPWQDWMGSLAAQNKLVDRGNRLMPGGNVIKPGNTVTDGPYVELKEVVGGYTIIRAANLEEATELAKSCPFLKVGGNVEVRAILPMD